MLGVVAAWFVLGPILAKARLALEVLFVFQVQSQARETLVTLAIENGFHGLAGGLLGELHHRLNLLAHRVVDDQLVRS